jgi:DNA-binding CsgD family transcriptional regulator
MSEFKESDFVEIIFDKLILESFPLEKSPYYSAEGEKFTDNLRNKLVWHINHSLSQRQKEVLRLYLQGKKEVEIGSILGVRQQVVNIYKRRAIKRLKAILSA